MAAPSGPAIEFFAQRLGLYEPEDFVFGVMVERLAHEHSGRVHFAEHDLSRDDGSAKGRRGDDGLVGTSELLGDGVFESVSYEKGHPSSITWVAPDGVAQASLSVFGETERLARASVKVFWPDGSDFPDRLSLAMKKRGFVPAHNGRDSDEVDVVFARPDIGTGIKVEHYAFPPEPLASVAGNYRPDVVTRAWDLIDRLKSQSHGLVIVNGPPGTGKTHLIRALMAELKDERQAVVCTPALDFVREAPLLMDVTTSFERSLVVFEDVGGVLATQAPSQHVESNAALLNFSDGLLSILSDSILLLSFNTDIGNVNPALLRPGRCLAHIEVPPLPFEQAQGLVPFPLITQREYVLADLYEARRRGVPPDGTPHRIGFASTQR